MQLFVEILAIAERSMLGEQRVDHVEKMRLTRRRLGRRRPVLRALASLHFSISQVR
jgi:hypothetical protein